MQLIEAALAFAITMLVLSILCTTLVETIHRLIGMREAGFRKMLGELYDHVLAPKLGAVPNPAAERWKFQRRMANMRGPVGIAGSEITPPYPTTYPAIIYDWVATIWRGRGISELTTTGFMEKLGTDSVGRTFAAAVGAAGTPAVDLALQDVAQKFDAFSKDATTFFERRARLISVCVAMFVAFALHVNAINLFQSLLTNTDARAAVLAMQDETLKANKRFEDQAQAQAKNPSAPPANLADVTKALKDSQEEIKTTLAKLQDTGASIGWTEKRAADAKLVWKFETTDCVNPKGKSAALKDGKCADPNTEKKSILIGLPGDPHVLIGLLLGGLLIGLGGPFWKDAITNITQVRDATRNLPGMSRPTTIVARASPAAPAGQAPTPQPQTPVDAFKVAKQ